VVVSALSFCYLDVKKSIRNYTTIRQVLVLSFFCTTLHLLQLGRLQECDACLVSIRLCTIVLDLKLRSKLWKVMLRTLDIFM
jgi:hypothetical protein